MSLFNAINLTNAFISVAPRSVGGSFRIMDAYDPRLRARGVSPEPGAVIKREAVSVSLVWIFTLLSSGLVSALQRRLRWPRGLVTLVTALAGNILAEGIARLVAYRNLGRNDQPAPRTPPNLSWPIANARAFVSFPERRLWPSSPAAIAFRGQSGVTALPSCGVYRSSARPGNGMVNSS